MLQKKSSRWVGEALSGKGEGGELHFLREEAGKDEAAAGVDKEKEAIPAGREGNLRCSGR